MPLSQEIQERVTHVLDYHRSSKYVRAILAKESRTLDLANQPSLFRTFESAPKIPLPTHLLDSAVPALEVLCAGLEALPDSYMRPPQDLKTLGSWLFYSAGIVKTIQVDGMKLQLRSSPSLGGLYPCEIYVAAFGIAGLEPGFYHFSVREFALRKLREGPETLWQIKRGRPDLEFLKTVPAALLVSTNFWRSAWKYQKRAYRHAVIDAGHLTENLSIVARGLGIQTVVRLRMTDTTMRELLGVPAHPEFATLEPVHAMVAWADAAERPLVMPKSSEGFPVPAPIVRAPLSPKPLSFGSIAAVHADCTGTGVAIRDIRPPLTELTPLPPTVHVNVFQDAEFEESETLRQAVLGRRTARDFVTQPITRDALATVTRIGFRGGSYFPLFPSGPHVGLLRPFWVIHEVSGMDPGAWYYHPPKDGWSLLRAGPRRAECRRFSMDQDVCAHASAVCWMTVNLQAVMNEAGPDAYRIAHLEAGVVGQRLAIAAGAIGLGVAGVAGFFDDEVRAFFGIERTGWEVLYGVAVGHPDESPDSENISSFTNYL